MSKPRVKAYAFARMARAAPILIVAALMFGSMSACYARVRPDGAYYSSGYYVGRGYRAPDRYYYPRERYRHYRAPGYHDHGRHHHHRDRDHHQRHHHDRRW